MRGGSAIGVESFRRSNASLRLGGGSLTIARRVGSWVERRNALTARGARWLVSQFLLQSWRARLPLAASQLPEACQSYQLRTHLSASCGNGSKHGKQPSAEPNNTQPAFSLLTSNTKLRTRRISCDVNTYRTWAGGPPSIPGRAGSASWSTQRGSNILLHRRSLLPPEPFLRSSMATRLCRPCQVGLAASPPR